MAMRSTVQNSIILLLFKNIRIVSAIIAIIIISIGYMTLVGPKYSDIRSSGILDVEEKKQLLANRELYHERLKELIETYNELSSKTIDELKRVLPRESDLPGMFVQLEALAEDAGYIPMSMTITEGGAATAAAGAKPVVSSLGTIHSMNVSMSMSGPNKYHDIKNLLRTFERNIRIFDVQSFTYSPSAENADEESTKNVSLSFRTYYLQSFN